MVTSSSEDGASLGDDAGVARVRAAMAAELRSGGSAGAPGRSRWYAMPARSCCPSTAPRFPLVAEWAAACAKCCPAMRLRRQ